VNIDTDWLLAQAPVLSAGILTADMLNLERDLDAAEAGGIRVLHVDVMDGCFCPPVTLGLPVVAALPDRFVRDVHLMVDAPLSKIEAFTDAGADMLTFHLESTRHPHRVLQTLSGSGVIRGVAINPGTPVAAVAPLLDDLEFLLLLAVNPGWGGQSFIPATKQRLAEARALVEDRPVALGVDGGITASNIADVASAGVDVIVAGSAIFDGSSPSENALSLLKTIVRRPPS
jgi:ribulose-phosphate 3-epimerase